MRARDKYTSQILFRVNLTEIYLPSVTSRGNLYAACPRIAVTQRQVIAEAASCQPRPHPYPQPFQDGDVRCVFICMWLPRAGAGISCMCLRFRFPWLPSNQNASGGYTDMHRFHPGHSLLQRACCLFPA